MIGVLFLNEIVDKEKNTIYILDNNDFDLEVNNLAKNYYDSLDDLGRKKYLINKIIIIKIDTMESEAVYHI